MATVMVRALSCGRVQRSHGFDPRAFNVGFVVDKVAIWQGFRRVCRDAQSPLPASPCVSPSVCTYECIISTHTRRIFIKFDTGDFCWKSVEEIQVLLKWDKNIGHSTWRGWQRDTLNSVTNITDENFCWLPMATFGTVYICWRSTCSWTTKRKRLYLVRIRALISLYYEKNSY
jgi:hypothetical protein